MTTTSAPASQNVVAISGRTRPIRRKVRCQQRVDDVQHQPQRPQAGIPQAEHRGGPTVSDDLPGLTRQVLEGIQRSAIHAHPSPASIQLRQPAFMLSSLPGHVEGAFAGGGPGAIIHRPFCHCIRSQ